MSDNSYKVTEHEGEVGVSPTMGREALEALSPIEQLRVFRETLAVARAVREVTA